MTDSKKVKEVKKAAKKEVKPKPKGYVFGRPTKYDEKYCQLLYDKMKAGYSVVRFCSHIDISKDTFYEWVKVYPDFSDSFKLSRTKCEAVWEEKFLDFMKDNRCNSPLVKLYYANMFKWTDKTEEKVVHSFSQTMEDIADKLPD